MTNLTDKWEKGELPAGYYYIEAITGEKIIDFMPYNENEFKLFPSHTSIVICEVPSFEQWIMTKNLSERAHLEMYKARGEKVRLEKENTKLKELLKECSELMDNTKVINIDVYYPE